MHLKRKISKDNSNNSFLSPVKISLIYGGLGLLWIAVSDRVALFLFEGTSIISQVQTFKGWLFVLATTLLIYVLTNRHQFTLNQLFQHSREIFAQANVGLAEIDTYGWVSVNNEFLRLTGMKEADLPNYSLVEFIHPSDREEFRFYFNKFLYGNNPPTYDKKVCLIDREREIRWFRISFKQITNQHTNRTSILIAAVDITDHELYQQYTTLQLKINESIEPAKSFEQAIQYMLGVVCQYTDWDIAEAWLPTSYSTLELYSAFPQEPEDDKISSFIEYGKTIQFGYGQGIPGTSWKVGEPQWIEDLSHDAHFSRSKEADKLGLKRALSVPLILHDRIQLVLIFYRLKSSGNDATLLHFFKRASMDIAVKLESKREYELRLKGESRLRYALKSANMATWEYNYDDGDFHHSENFNRIFGLNKGSLVWDIPTIFDQIHPKDQDEVKRQYQQSLTYGAGLNVEFRLNRELDTHRWLWLKAEVFQSNDTRDGKGRISGVVMDINQRKQTQQRVIDYRDRLEKAQEIAKLGYWEYHIEEDRLHWTPMVFEIFGINKDEFQPSVQKFIQMVHPADREVLVEKQKQAIKSGETMEIVYRLVKPDGSIGYYRERGEVTQWETDGVTARIFSGTVLDISELKESQKRLARSEAGYRMIFHQNPQPLWIYDIDTLKFVEVNSAAAQQYGYSRDEFMQMTIKDIRPSDELPAFMEMLKQKKHDEAHMGEWIHLKRNGERINVQVQSAKIEYLGRPMRLVMAIDITEQKRAEEREFNSLLEGGDRERRRIASELHDGLGQYLTAAQLKMSVVRKQIGSLDKTKQDQFHSGMDLLKQALDESRTIAYNLMPRSIEDYGLQLALESLASTYQRTKQLEFSLIQQFNESKLGKQQLINIYRITQEAVQNAVKHGQASEINLQLLMEDQNLYYTFEDNGLGFDLSNIEKEHTGLGIHNIQMRAKAMSAEIFWDSAPDYGTTISIKIPLLTNKSYNNLERQKE